MPERLSYTDFIEEFLIACAVVMNRNTAVLIDTDLAADYITKDFEKSWPDAAVKQLANNGLLRGSYIVSKPTRYNLTGEGLTYAERLVEDQGKNLADLTDAYAQAMRQEESGQAIERVAFPKQSDSPVLSAQEEIDQSLRRENLLALDDAAASLHAHIERTLRDLRKSGPSKAKNLLEISQDVNRIETDRRLLQTERAHQDLLEFLLLVSLRWFYPRVQQDRHRALIQQFAESIETALDRAPSENIGRE